MAAGSFLIALIAGCRPQLVLGALEESVGMERWKLLYGLFLLLFIQAMLFHFLTIFTDIYDKVKDMNPVWFYRVEHLIEFWL